MAYQNPFQPSPYRGRSSYGQNPWVMAIARMIAERQNAPQFTPEQQELERQSAIQELRNMPDQPYLEGLSPMARYRDMYYRDQGRSANLGAQIKDMAANQGLIEDAAMGVTRQPDGRVTTQAGAVITPPTGYPAQQTLTSPYGTGSSTRVPMGQGRGTFSFQDAQGNTITAPFSQLKDPRFMKMMREEEVAREPRVAQRRKEREG